MPLPALAMPIAAGVGAYLGYQALGAGWQIFVDPLIEPEKLYAAHKAWAAKPYLIPPVEALQRLILTGRATSEDDAMAGLLAQGVYPWGGTFRGQLWRDVMEMMRPRPGISDIIQAYVIGELTWDKVCELMRKEGADPSAWTWAISSALVYPTILDATLLRNRGFITDTIFKACVDRAGLANEFWHDVYSKMRQSLPGPQDVIRFAVREAFNEEQVKILGLDEELDQNPQYVELCKAVGVGPAEYVDDKGQSKTVDTPRLYWRAHWQLPSPTQAYDWLRRLRPSRIRRFAETLPADMRDKLRPFTGEMLNALLKANDYAPQWRPYLAASSYLPLTRVDARRLFDSRLITKQELVEQYLDQGYVKEDAEKMADWAESDRDLAKRLVGLKAIAKEAIKGYELGWMTREAAARAIYPTTLRSIAELSEWMLLTEAQQTATALGHHQVRAELEAIDARLRSQMWSEAIRTIAGRVMDGMISLVDARAELQRLGMTAQRIQYWTTRWGNRLRGPRRTLALRQLVQYQTQGIITAGELVRRARNLGYPPEDLQIIMAGAERNVKLALARQRVAEEKDAKAKAKAYLQALREIEREMQRTRNQLAWKVPATTIVKWYQQGRISRENAAAALSLKGHKAREIELLLTPTNGAT